jgi:hypothetical protein
MMKTDSKTIDQEAYDLVATTCGRPLVHMRQQIKGRRFGLVIGAGASKDLGLPKWDELVDRIAKHPEVQGEALIKELHQHSSKSQVLFQSYRSRLYEAANSKDRGCNLLEMKIRAGWRTIVHECLYRNVDVEPKTLFDKDQYLWAFLNVIKDSSLTVNYNFDDSLQRLLTYRTDEDEKLRRRAYATVWSADTQMFPRSGVIYHPNGYLPASLTERPSDQLIFLEDAFADQLIESMTGHYTALSYHLAQNTCLLIGLSLDDPTLKHLLRHNSRLHPGHYHYYVAFTEDSSSLPPTYVKSVSDANFETYNLITLFLNRKELAALGKLLEGAVLRNSEEGRQNDNELQYLMKEKGIPTTYKFLITGCVAVGKSTAVGQFRSLKTYDEWLSDKPPGMEKDPSKVNSKSIKTIDDWVFEQLRLKNRNLADAAPGIHIVDRAPLDAFAFTKTDIPSQDEWVEKATNISQTIHPGVSQERLIPAKIILLTGDPLVLESRAIGLHKDTSADKLRKQQYLLGQVYDLRYDGIAIIDTRDLSIAQVTKKIAQVIHRDSYREFDMHKWIEGVINKSILPPVAIAMVGDNE